MTSASINQPVPPSDRGAILVQTAMVLLALMAFAAFSVDYGVLWASRRQAQNAADAAALSGAISFAFDPNDLTSSGVAYQSAERVLQDHRVWAAAPAYQLILGLGPGGPACPASEPGPCIRVNVYRDAFHNNPLPTFFGKLVGLNSQDIQATATAIAAPANAADCLGPFAIPDKYVDVTSPATDFNGSDYYVAPTASGPGTGYTLATDLGTPLTLHGGSGTQLAPGWYRLLDLVGAGGGGTPETWSMIKGCTADVYGIGDDLGSHLQSGTEAAIKHAIDDLVLLDPAATWDPGTKSIINSCVQTHTCSKYPASGTGAAVPDPSATVSPRVMALAVFDPAAQAADNNVVKIVNILGFFIIGTSGPGNKNVDGILCTKPGQIAQSKASLGAGSSFIKSVQLIR